MFRGPHIREKIINVVVHFVAPNTAAMIMPLWRQGYDTKTIAETLSLPEHAIANKFAEIRDAQ